MSVVPSAQGLKIGNILGLLLTKLSTVSRYNENSNAVNDEKLCLRFFSESRSNIFILIDNINIIRKINITILTLIKTISAISPISNLTFWHYDPRPH